MEVSNMNNARWQLEPQQLLEVVTLKDAQRLVRTYSTLSMVLTSLLLFTVEQILRKPSTTCPDQSTIRIVFDCIIGYSNNHLYAQV